MRISGFLLLVCTLAALAACAGGSAASAPQFPAYTTQDARLFDDSIDPRVLGVSYDAPMLAPRSDTALFERTHIGDGVVRGRIDSVTVRGTAAQAFYELGVRVVEPLARADVLGGEFVLRVDPTSPSYNMVRSLQDRLSGHAMIVFVRTYANDQGEPVPHFYMVPDDPRVAAAVREAASLDRIPLMGDGGKVAPATNGEKAEKMGR